MPKTLFGSCLCGAIKYQFDGLGPQMAHCHCTMCRKFHGAAFATFGEVNAEHFRWLQGEELLSSFAADNGTVRKFCRRCGSSLIFQSSDNRGEIVEVALGTLDVDIEQKPDAHIYTDYKASWYDITDSLVQCKRGR